MQRIGLRKGKKRAIHTFGEVVKKDGEYEIKKLFNGEVFCRVKTKGELMEGFAWIIILPFLGKDSPMILSELTVIENELLGIFEAQEGDIQRLEVRLDNRGRARNLKAGKKYAVRFIPRKRFFELYERMPLGRGKRAEPSELAEERVRNFEELAELKKGCRVLDTATGIKEYLRNFSRECHTICLNISPSILKKTKEWLASENASFVAYDTERGFPFKDETLDLVVCDALLEYVLDPHLTLGHISRITKKGGRLLLLEPTKSGKIRAFYPQDLWEIALWRPRYDPLFNQDSIEKTLEKEGFEILEKREMKFRYPIYEEEEFSQPIVSCQKV